MENNEAYALPDLSSTPIGDFELLEEHLRPSYRRYMSERRSGCQAGVNAGLPLMNPWDLIPAVTRQEERREKYFLTTNPLCVDMIRLIFGSNVEASQGSWKPRGHLGWVIKDKNNPLCCVGYKMTYDFYTRTGHPSPVDTNTSWIMNVYFLIDDKNGIQEEMVLCHVFQNIPESPDYDPRPKCTSFLHPLLLKRIFLPTHQEFGSPKRSCGSCSYKHSGKPCNEAIYGPSSSSFCGTAPGSLSTHHGSNRPSESEITAYMQYLNSYLLGDDPDISTDAGNYDSRGDENGQSGKRARTSSDVWQRFTKIFAHGLDGVLTLAACNHCCKVLTGDSKKGTSHLRRHKCPCNH